MTQTAFRSFHQLESILKILNNLSFGQSEPMIGPRCDKKKIRKKDKKKWAYDRTWGW